jgi:hypothetical protein
MTCHLRTVGKGFVSATLMGKLNPAGAIIGRFLDPA